MKMWLMYSPNLAEKPLLQKFKNYLFGLGPDI